jgi:hypothetical protein
MTKKRFTLLFVFAFVLAACGGGGTPTEEPAATGAGLCANDYMPVIEGASWSYLSTGPTGDYAYTNALSAVADDGFTLTTSFDDFTLDQQWACSADGLAQLEFSPGPEANLVGSGLSASYETTSMSGVTLPPTISAGDTWSQTFEVTVQMTMGEGAMSATGNGSIQQTFTAIGVESISTAAGTFDAMKVNSVLHVDMTINMDNGTTVPVVLDTQADMFWVEGVGLVHSNSTSTISGGEPIEVNADLQSYVIP